MPSWEIFEEQDDAYKESILPKNIKERVAIEAGKSLANSNVGVSADEDGQVALTQEEQ